MSRIPFPYILTLAVLLFVIGIYGALSRSSRAGIAGGIFVMLSGLCIGALGFAAFLPTYFIKPWTGYALAGVVMFGLAGVGLRGMREGNSSKG